LSNNCGGQLLGVGNLNTFIDRVNTFYNCLGVPFEFFKCANWDSANDNVLSDGSTRLVCSDDLSIFYTSSCADGTDPCCCDGDLACISNCNFQPDPFGDGVSDFSEAIDLNIPNVMNIYIPINYNGYTPGGGSEGGVAYLPSGDFSYGTSFGVNGIQNISQDCTGTSGSTVSIHEFGHFFGLLHTHGAVNNAQVSLDDPNDNYWVECPDGSECCTLGDYICDTPPDPNTRTSNVEDSNGNEITNCVNNNGCDYDLSNCYSTCGVPYPSNYTNNNIMSYGTCDNFLTECQIAKMVDALFCARNNLSCCDPDLVDSSTADPYVTENTFYLCPGDPIPTFTIDNPAGNADNIALNTNCIGWYASDNNTLDFDVLATGLSFTPPATGSGALDTNIPGTYTYFFDDDLNNYSLITCQNDIRKQVTIIVTDDAGTGNAPITISDCGQDQLINLNNNQAQISSNDNIVGWYFSTDDPNTTLNTSAQISSAINGAATGDPNNANLNEIFQANNGQVGLDGFTINCDQLANDGGDGSYYITPFVAYEENDVICSLSISGDPIDWSGGEGASAGPFFPLTDCDAQGLTNYTYEIVIDIGGCDNPFDTFIFEVKPGAACLSQQPTGNNIVSCSQDSFVFTEAMIQNEFPGYDPFINVFCLNAINANGTFTGMDYLATLNIIYTGQSAQDYWNSEGTPNILSTDETANCFWGTPQEIICNCGSVGVCPQTQQISSPGQPPICSSTNPSEAIVNSWKNMIASTDGSGAVVTPAMTPAVTSIIYSSNPNYTVNDFPTSNWDAEPAIMHSGACEDEILEFHSYVICDLTDEVTLVSSYLLMLTQPPQEPLIVLNDDVCTYSIQLVCPNETSNPSSIPDAPPGTDPNPVDITVSTPDCSKTFTVDPPPCGDTVCFEIIDYNVEAGDCDLSGVEIQLLDEAGAVLDTQPINANGSSGSFGTYFCGVYYLQLVNVPDCFTNAGGSTGPKLINLDGEGNTFVTFSPFPMIPTLSQWGLIIMALLFMVYGALKLVQKQLSNGQTLSY